MLVKAIRLLLVPALVACTSARGVAAASTALTPSRVDSFQVAMPQLGDRTRTIRVYLPPGYVDAGRRYPVLYLQDAQQLFSPGWFGDWRVDETLDRLVTSG